MRTLSLFGPLILIGSLYAQTRSASPSPTVALATAASYVFTQPYVVASADLNGDGILDLVEGGSPANISVLLGKGDGTFLPPVNYPVADSTGAIVIADLNHDGKPDLAIGTFGGASILLGNGDGSFQPYKSYGGSGYYGLAVGDFNGDGSPDLALATGNQVGILLGNGDGSFRSPAYYGSDRALGAVVGDFNGDGLLDVVTVDPGTAIQVFLGNGDGTFATPILMAGKYEWQMTAADFNGDGNLDLAVSNEHGGVTVFLGKGNGHFKLAGTYSFGQNLGSLVAADVNGDGKADLVASANISIVGGIAILLGNGDGTFQKPVTSAGQGNLGSIAVGDFNGDGRIDVAAPQYAGFVTVNLQTTAALSPGLLSVVPTLEKKTTATTVTLANLGSAAFHVSSLVLSGVNATEFALANDTCTGASVAPAANCTVQVNFTPAATGPQNALLSVTDDASVTQQTTAITANGTTIEMSPARLDFGSVAVGSFSPQQLIRATNMGSAPIEVRGIYIVGRNSKDFVQTNSCGASLAPKATCSILVQFVPAKKGAAAAGTQFNIRTGTQFDPKNVVLAGKGT